MSDFLARLGPDDRRSRSQSPRRGRSEDARATRTRGESSGGGTSSLQDRFGLSTADARAPSRGPPANGHASSKPASLLDRFNLSESRGSTAGPKASTSTHPKPLPTGPKAKTSRTPPPPSAPKGPKHHASLPPNPYRAQQSPPTSFPPPPPAARVPPSARLASNPGSETSVATDGVIAMDEDPAVGSRHGSTPPPRLRPLQHPAESPPMHLSISSTGRPPSRSASLSSTAETHVPPRPPAAVARSRSASLAPLAAPPPDNSEPSTSSRRLSPTITAQPVPEPPSDADPPPPPPPLSHSMSFDSAIDRGPPSSLAGVSAGKRKIRMLKQEELSLRRRVSAATTQDAVDELWDRIEDLEEQRADLELEESVAKLGR